MGVCAVADLGDGAGDRTAFTCFRSGGGGTTRRAGPGRAAGGVWRLDWVQPDGVLSLPGEARLGSAGGEESSRAEGSSREAAWPGTPRAREAALVEEPFESPPPPSRTAAAAGREAGREGAGRANFKPPARPLLPAPQNRLVHSAGRGPFPDGPPYLPSCSLRSVPRRQPFPAHSQAPGFRARTLGGTQSPPGVPRQPGSTKW